LTAVNQLDITKYIAVNNEVSYRQSYQKSMYPYDRNKFLYFNVPAWRSTRLQLFQKACLWNEWKWRNFCDEESKLEM